VPRDAKLHEILEAGAREHYVDALLYDHEYKRRRADVIFYRAIVERGPILELGCGTGRLLIPLVRDGHEVVGVDHSQHMLARCSERLERAKLHAMLVRADFRNLDLGRKFPLVVCPFNAFMHLYQRRDVEQFLDGVRRHLAPRGRFAFDVMNPDLAWLARDPLRRWARTRFRHPRTGEPMVYSTTLAWDGPRQLAMMRIYYQRERGGRERSVRLVHRYFFPQELEALLHYNGFAVERHDGGFCGEELATDSEEQVIIARAV
jgi:SAM-dependent methyltransferase